MYFGRRSFMYMYMCIKKTLEIILLPPANRGNVTSRQVVALDRHHSFYIFILFFFFLSLVTAFSR